MVLVEVYYVFWDGVYMFYCYNFIYEDDDMMVVFNVIVLFDFGYSNFFVKFLDFMELRWRVKLFVMVDFIVWIGLFLGVVID